MENREIKPIDVAAIVKRLWQHKKKYCYVLPATLVVTYLLMVCLPRYYSCTVKLAPETPSDTHIGVGSLASSFGLGSTLAKMASNDAIYAELYPEVICSKDFIAELMTVDVVTSKGDTKCNFYVYMRDKQKAPWWTVVIETIKSWVKPGEPDTHNGKEKLSVFRLSELQDNLFNAVKGNVKCAYDKKTEVVSITVKDQDPLVCATIADAACRKLQEFIVAYRTNKARIDQGYYKRLCAESKSEYEKARRNYAAYADSHHKAVMMGNRTKEEMLESEMLQQKTTYTAMITQLQLAEAKLQEATPAFTVIESASVPIKPAGPKRMIISIAMMMLAFFVLTGWILLRR